MAAGQVLVEPAAQWALRAAWHIADLVDRRVEAGGTCSLALAGGTTPRPVYLRLGQPPLSDRIPWPALQVYFSDERALPPEHADSNFRMASDAFLSRVPLHPGQIHRMEAERRDLDAAARAYARQLPVQIDVLLLGMGADAHTASLFPGDPALRERRRRVVPVLGGIPLVPRLTITGPVILAAAEVVVLVTGKNKAGVVAQVLEGPVDATRLPAQLARDRWWILDHDAAGRLGKAHR